jgi:hypothetical protein
VEIVVNGVPVDAKRIRADGSVQAVSFEVFVGRSSWIALRVLPSSHTNPIFVLVDSRPVRASRRSIQWCLDCVDKLWTVKSPLVSERERAEARTAYNHASQVYRQSLAECDTQ